MQSDRIDRQAGVPGHAAVPQSPRTLQAAAEQFEHVLVKQMVRTMTNDLFDSSLAGDDGPQWIGAYSDMQSDILATELADQLAESGRLGIAELLVKQWQRRAEAAEAAGQDSNQTEEPL